MMDERYSKIVVGSCKIHIFDHEENRILCGLDRWKNTPFRVYKTKFNANTMLYDHTAIGERRGGDNPYKWMCLRCNASIKRISNKEN